MKIIPDRCPRCFAAPHFEGNAHTLYLCGSVIYCAAAADAGIPDKIGEHCKQVSSGEVKLLG